MSLVGGVGAAQEALADGGGSLISIGTTATAEHFASGSGSYSAFKAAVTNWTLGQAQVLGAQGIRCNVVSPGPIMVEGGDWDGIKQGMPEFYEATQKTHPQFKPLLQSSWKPSLVVSYRFCEFWGSVLFVLLRKSRISLRQSLFFLARS